MAIYPEETPFKACMGVLGVAYIGLTKTTMKKVLRRTFVSLIDLQTIITEIRRGYT